MDRTATLFRIAGVPVRVKASWLFIFGLLAWSLSVGYFPRVLPGLPSASYWVDGVLAALLLFGSVLLHELSHSIVARWHGLPVAGITLHVFGGVSQLEREPTEPGVEFRVGVVGPLTSFGLAGALAAAGPLLREWPAAAAVVRYLATINVVLGVFNLVPGLPLDGGRLLRALLWKLRGDRRWATAVASGVGKVVAGLLIVIGFVRIFSSDFVGGLWLVLVGLFLHETAGATARDTLIRHHLARLSVRDVMSAPVVSVSPDLTLARVVTDVFWRHHVSSFPVLDGPRLVGILGLQQVKAVPIPRWAEVRVRDVMLTAAPPLLAAPDESLVEALDKLARNGLGRLAVVEDGALSGYLSLKDVLHVLALPVPAERRGEAVNGLLHRPTPTVATTPPDTT